MERSPDPHQDDNIECAQDHLKDPVLDNKDDDEYNKEESTVHVRLFD